MTLGIVFTVMIFVCMLWNLKLSREISDRKKIEAELRKSEEQYRSIVNILPFLISYVDKDLKYTFVNETYHHVFNIKPSDIIGKPLVDIIGKEAFNRALPHIDIALNGGEVHYHERFEYKPGDIREIDGVLLPDKGADSKVKGYYAVLNDITPYIDMQKSLRESQRRLSRLIEYIQAGIVVNDNDGTIVECNSTAEKILGFRRDRLIGIALQDFRGTVLREDGSVMPLAEFPALQVVRHGKAILNRLLGVRNPVRDQTIWMLISCVPDFYKDTGNPQVISTFMDVTDRILIVKRLAENEKKFRLFFDMANDAIFLYSIDPETGFPGKFIEVNQSACDWLEFSKAELLAKGPLDIISPGFVHQPDNLRRAIIEKKKYTHEIMIQTKTGKNIWVESNLRQFDYMDQKVVLVVSRNITERKEIEKQLLQAKEAAEVASRAKSEFIAHMNHEFRTPLNAILGYAQILIGDKGLKRLHREHIRTIKQSGEHLLTLINDILDIAKIETGKLDLKPSFVDLYRFLRNATEILRIKANHKRIELIEEIDPTLPRYVMCDEKRLRQTLLNLLSNAVKFTDKGSVTLSVKPKKGKISFAVRDSGPGIPREEAEKIFHPFWQGSSFRSKTEGAGLGLSISQSLVGLMGGEITVESTIGQGSCFTFELEFPEISGEGNVTRALPEKNEKKTIDFHGSPTRVLIVDKTPLNRQLIKEVLFPLGFQIAETACETEIEHIAEAFIPNIVFMDINTSQSEIHKMIGKVRSAVHPFNPIIILVTGKSQREMEVFLDKSGAHDYIEKPIIVDELLAKIHKHLSLGWLYEQPEVELTKPNGHETRMIEPPAPSILNKFLRMSDIGDITGIRKYAEHLIEQDPQTTIFCERILTNAKKFQINEIKALLREFGA